jgi:hypothetical protein
MASIVTFMGHSFFLGELYLAPSCRGVSQVVEGARASLAIAPLMTFCLASWCLAKTLVMSGDALTCVSRGPSKLFRSTAIALAGAPFQRISSMV